MGVILGTLEADTIRGTEGLDVITGLSGADVIMGMGGIDVIDGGLDNDTLYANTKGKWDDGTLDTVLGGAGDDHIYGGYGDILNGGTGFDVLSLDLSSATGGIQLNFKPAPLIDIGELEILEIDGTQLSGFQAVADVRGSAFDDRVVVGNSDGFATHLEGAEGNDFLRASNGNDGLSGGTGDDTLVGQFGTDTLFGGEGRDRLQGGRSEDTLTGGADADRFVFNTRDSAASRGQADTITDFSHAAHDKILLSGIDAVAGGGDDRFTFIGTDRFSGQAGELRFLMGEGDTFVSADIDGDMQADFTIRLDGQVDLVAGDFQL